MNMILVVGGAAVLLVYLAGRRASKALDPNDQPTMGDAYGGGDGGGGGFYGGGGGGDGSGGATSNEAAGESENKQASPGAGFALLPDSAKVATEGPRLVSESFISGLGYQEGASRSSGLTDEGASNNVKMMTLDLGGGSGGGSSAGVTRQAAPLISSATSLGSSASGVSRPLSTVASPLVTSAAVAASPVRTMSTTVAKTSATAAKSAPISVAKTTAPVGVSTMKAFTTSIGTVSAVRR